MLKNARKTLSALLCAALCAGLLPSAGVAQTSSAPERENLALNRPVTVSGIEGGTAADGALTYPQFAAENLTDGDTSTRWSSDEGLTSYELSENPGQNVWAAVDLGAQYEIGRVVLLWGRANARDYDLQYSLDGTVWEVMCHREDPDAEAQMRWDTLIPDSTVSARYIRVYARSGNEIAGIALPTVSLSELYVYAADPALETVRGGALSLSADNSRLILPEAPDGYSVQLWSTGNPAVIHSDLSVTAPLTDMTVNVFYRLENLSTGELTEVDEPLTITVPGRYDAADSVNAEPQVIPGLREWYGLEGDFLFSGGIVLADSSLSETAEQIAMYFSEMAGVDAAIRTGSPRKGDIYLVRDTSCVLGDEGYELDISDVLTVRAATDTGILYGGTTICQILSQSDELAVPKGLARDYPQYSVRGVMLDVARISIPLDYLEEITKYAAYFKLNEFHVHLNDIGGERVASFRIESKLHPKLIEDTRYYTQDDYREYQKEVAAFGIDVISELDTPGHSLAIAFDRPDLMLDDQNIDLSNPDAVEYVKGLYDEFLDGDDPVFCSSTFHIGTDEYKVEQSSQLLAYMDEMITYVNAKGLSARLWGSLSDTGITGEFHTDGDATAQIWSNSWGSVVSMRDCGFSFINSISKYLYIVPGAPNGTVDRIDLAARYDEWEVSDYGNGTGFAAGHPLSLGAEAALWYDIKLGADEFDIFDRMRDQIMLISEKTWYGESSEGQTGADFAALAETLGAAAPDANPARFVSSVTDLVASYDFESVTDGVVTDGSGNGYDARLEGLDTVASDSGTALALDGSGYLSLPFDSIGYPYTVRFTLTVDSSALESAALFDGDDGTICWNYGGTGRLGYNKHRSDYTIGPQLSCGEELDIALVCTGDDSYMFVNGVFAGAAAAYENGIYRDLISGCVLPTERIGSGVTGTLDDLRIYSRALSAQELIAG